MPLIFVMLISCYKINRSVNNVVCCMYYCYTSYQHNAWTNSCPISGGRKNRIQQTRTSTQTHEHSPICSSVVSLSFLRFLTARTNSKCYNQNVAQPSFLRLSIAKLLYYQILQKEMRKKCRKSSEIFVCANFFSNFAYIFNNI